MGKIDKIKDVIPGYNSLVLPKHWASAVKAGVKHGWPAKKLRVIGVTGTNGKTTTCFMIWKMLNTAGRKAGLMTTVAWGVEELHEQVEHMTTVDAETLNSRIERIAEEGAEFLVLEVTSHAMVQFRTLGVPVEIAVMTNVTHEHLDYHKTFERYREAKQKLFRKARFGVVNADDGSAKYFMESVGEDLDGVGLEVERGEWSDEGFEGKYITYGIKKGKMRAFEVEMGAGGVKYACGDINEDLNESGDNVQKGEAVGEKSVQKGGKMAEKSAKNVKKSGKFVVKTRIPGEFNVYNSLAAVCVGRKVGLTDKEICDGIYALTEVEGRMNRVDEGQDFEVIVDFAHTPDAFLKVFESVKGHRGRILTVTGGAGRRDESTRAERGEIAGKNSDILVITEDDSRDEAPEEIAQMFVEGAERAGKKMGVDLFVNLDRESGIRQTLEMARKGDLVLVLGKGHEKTIIRKGGAEAFEDLKVVRSLLRGGK